MTTVSKIAVEIICVAINVGMAKYEAWRFDKLQKTIDHKSAATFYAVLVSAPIGVIVCSGDGSWSILWIWLSAVAMHFPLFSTALNRFRLVKRPWFYHNTADPNGSKWDLWLGKYYIPMWFGCVVAWVALQFLIF